MRTVPDRRQGAAVAFLAEIVTAFHGRGRMFSPSASPVAVGWSPASTQ